jgi:hypothetical protein
MNYPLRLNKNVLTRPSGMSRAATHMSPYTMKMNTTATSDRTANAIAQLFMAASISLRAGAHQP